MALFQTVLGDFYVELQNAAAPKHVENFTKYANETDPTKSYDGTFLHRSSSLETDTTTGLPDITKPVKVLQGGGYKVNGATRIRITSGDPVALEYSLPNARGTLAAARGSGLDTATSEWFFNVVDNSTILGPTNGVGGYTVFGKVVGSGMEVVDAMANVKRFRYSSSFVEMPLRDYTAGPVTDDKLVLITNIQVVPIQPPADGSNLGALRYTATSSALGIVEPRVLGSTLTLIPRSSGTATVTVTATEARTTSVTATFTVTVAPGAPIITASPRSQTVAPGGSVTFSVTAIDGPTGYQWSKNGTAISGATGSTLTLTNVSAADAGDYTVAIVNPQGTTVSRPASLLVATPEPGALINLSIRAKSQPFIAGFVTAGPVNVLVRGIGPTLTSYGVAGAMSDPRITLDPLGVSNDNWGDSPVPALQAAFARVGAFPIADTTSKDAALLASVDGASSVLLTPATGENGPALIEVYDLRETGGRLINVSARVTVGTGGDVLIAGFVIGGNVPKRVLIRAVGPTLANYGVTGLLTNPVLTVYRAIGGTEVQVATNDDWGDNPELGGSTWGGFPLNAGSTDSALLLTLPAGVYSAQVTGFDGGTGVALIEVYEVD
ncbi:MAG TPA: peptidylprolyl isomerase [Candidatus Synoicihabitans sp.]|nr:peptidylprolyl isomerase [Candidatus Synoicihabitans sp.]